MRLNKFIAQSGLASRRGGCGGRRGGGFDAIDLVEQALQAVRVAA